ncbi:MAG: LysR family transcriptional regulator substrate-binding protein [Blautia marasmi]
MDMENEFENYLNDFEALRTGHLSVGGSNLFASYVLPPLLSEFMGKYPSVDVKMTESTTNDLETQLFSGSLDLVIDNYPFSDSIYERHFFCREQLLLAVPAALVHGKQPEAFCLDASSIKDGSYEDSAVCPSIIQYFASAPFLLLRAGNDTRERSDLLLKNAGLTPSVPLKLDQQVTAYHLACYGMGIAFVTDTLIRHVPVDSNIVFYKLEPAFSQRNIYFYHKRSRYVTRAMEEFLKIADSAFSVQP